MVHCSSVLTGDVQWPAHSGSSAGSSPGELHIVFPCRVVKPIAYKSASPFDIDLTERVHLLVTWLSRAGVLSLHPSGLRVGRLSRCKEARLISVQEFSYGGFSRPWTIRYAEADTFCERHEESIAYESEMHRGSMKKHTPRTGNACLARFGVCLGGTLRGYASGSVEVPPPL